MWRMSIYFGVLLMEMLNARATASVSRLEATQQMVYSCHQHILTIEDTMYRMERMC
jgi:hypothetical protein